MPKPDDNKQSANSNTTNQDANNTNDDATTNDDNASQNTQPTNVEYVTMDTFNEMRNTLESFQETMNTIMGGIKSIRDAQGVMVRAGMIVQDDAEPEPADDFKPLSELDFSVKR